MEFKQFRDIMNEHVYKMLYESQDSLFIMDVDKDEMWDTYLSSFPEGTNKLFRKRREFDCSCCRHFIKSFGNVVMIKNSEEIITIWDFGVSDPKYQTVINALSKMNKSKQIRDVFITKEQDFGTDHNLQQLDNKTVHTWDHFYVRLPGRYVSNSSKSVGTLTGAFRDAKNVFKRSLEEISIDAVETILDLISQKSLYKGEEWKAALSQFLSLQKEYHNISSDKKRDIFYWDRSVKLGGAITKIRNHSIGVLLTDISNGMDLDEAVRRYEKIVAPTNYKRPKAIYSKKMIEQAQKTITELGFLDSLRRRFAIMDDITIPNVLFANRDCKRKMGADIFDDMKQEVAANPKKFDKLEEVPIETFVKDMLPNVSNIEIMLENRHESNLVSLIAPQIANSKTLFKWTNGFSWAYNGNITDSMKERVKAAGGNIEGVLRFSIQWNEQGGNQNDFDAHCKEPKGGDHIYFPNKRIRHNSSGMLDVDIINPGDKVAVENIVYTNLEKMPIGIYDFYVNVYSYRGGSDGFSAEVEFDGNIYSFSYPKDVRSGEDISVAKVELDTSRNLKITKSMPSSAQSRTLWNLGTNQFHPVTICLFSPNYWDEQTGIGNRHYFFMLNNCRREDRPNGFFNEFLKEELLEHKRVFEALGGKMKVESSDNQLSGLGFSSTKRNSVICKLEGNFTRTIKLTF